MKLFFSSKAIDKLTELDCFDNLCFLTVRDCEQGVDNTGYNRIIMRAKVTNYAAFPYEIETQIGTIHYTKNVKHQFGDENRIDYDDFRHSFVHIRDGHVVDDNILLDK